jgi:hypothetical protein
VIVDVFYDHFQKTGLITRMKVAIGAAFYQSLSDNTSILSEKTVMLMP